MGKVYFHIDLNAFYASAEILLNPELAGKPIAVSGETRRSVVSTASYEARRFGVSSAMPIQEAQRLCPELIICQPHFSYYHELSDQFMELIKSYSSEFEQASIDECYIEVTKLISTYERPMDLAWEIQARVLKEIGLKCSIGVGPNMFLAKMASDMKKPLGITILRIREVPQKLWPLDIQEMRGVGKKTVPLLRRLGINTIGDLANYEDRYQLQKIFGKNTDKMINRAHGLDDRQIEKEQDYKSMGVSETLLEDIVDEDEIYGVYRQLSRKLSKRLLDEKKVGRTISIRIRYHDFQTIDRTRQLPQPIWKADDLFQAGMNLFQENWDGEPIRLLGISLSGFMDEAYYATQLNLFDERLAQEEETDSVLKDLNALLESNQCLKRARDVLKKDEDA